jgi:dimethylglycine dehydrogenase
MEHQYIITEDLPELAGQPELLHVIDFEGEIYMRQERGGVLLGTYERSGVPWSPRTTPWDFGQDLLPNDLERIAPSLEVGFKHFPRLGEVGIRRIVNGPFTFAPDGNPLVGPVPGMRNFWVACGVMAGFSQGGGVGLALSHWMVDGDPGADIWPVLNVPAVCGRALGGSALSGEHAVEQVVLLGLEAGQLGRQAHIAGRRQGQQARFFGLRDVQA